MKLTSNTQLMHDNLVNVLLEQVKQHPNKTAFTLLNDKAESVSTLTYTQLYANATKVAKVLLDKELTGERILLLYPSSLEFMSAFLGCLCAGAIAVPVYPPRANRSIQRIQTIANSCNAKLALTTPNILEKVNSKFKIPSELNKLEWIATENEVNANPVNIQFPVITSDTLAYLQFTSGSTGTPKGVMITHGNLLATLEDMHRGWGHDKQSVMVTWLPIFHDMGLIYGLLQPIYNSFPCYLIPSITFVKKPMCWLKAISKYNGTHSASPNFGYDLCINKINDSDIEQLNLSSWRVAVNAAEPVRQTTTDAFVKKFAKIGFKKEVFCPGYGLAEATLKASAKSVDTTLKYLDLDANALNNGFIVEANSQSKEIRQVANCGQSDIQSEIIIVHPNDKRECNADEVGEIWMSGKSIGQGYWQNEKATKETFQAYLNNGEGPFMRTGDLGFIHNGDVYVTGRLKDLIIIRGKNHYPHDIEWTMENAHSSLLAGAGVAFSIEKDNKEQLVVIQEVKRTEIRKINGEEVIKAIKKAIIKEHDIEIYGVVLVKPRRVLKTSSGKLQRRACKKLFLEETLDILYSETFEQETVYTEFISPQQEAFNASNIEREIIRQVAKILKISPQEIHRKDAIDDIGLDSMSKLDLIVRLENQYYIQISTPEVIEITTIAELAALIEQKKPNYHQQGERLTANHATLVPLQLKGHAPPILFFTAGYGDAYALNTISKLLGDNQPFYMVQPPIQNNIPVCQTLEALVAHYVQTIGELLSKEQPMVLGGYSAGGIMSYEVAKHLEAKGHQIKHLLLLDPPVRQTALSHAWYKFVKWTVNSLYKDTTRLKSRRLKMTFALFKDRGLAQNLTLLKGHTSQDYKGKATFFQGNISFYRLFWTAQRWKKAFKKDNYEVVITKGDHDNFLRMPHVGGLVEAMKKKIKG